MGTFGYDKKLKCIMIPKSIVSIDNMAFWECSSLTDIYYGGSKEDWEKISIGSRNQCLYDAEIHFNSFPTLQCELDNSLEGVTVKYNLSNVFQPAKTIITGYKDGILAGTIITDNKNGAETLKGSFDTVKIMAWSNISSLSPLVGSVSFEK